MTSSSYEPQRPDRVLNELRDDLEELHRGRPDPQFVLLYLQRNAQLLGRAIDSVIGTPAEALEELRQTHRLNRSVIDGANLSLVVGALDTARQSTPERLRDTRWLEVSPDEYAVENLMRYVSYAAYLMSGEGEEVDLHPVKRWLGRTAELVDEFAPASEAAEQMPDSDAAPPATESAEELPDSDAGPPTPRPPGGAHTPHYTADSYAATRVGEGADPLDIRTDVEMLASLIASTNVEPPLSIGIFGEWGSGKSYFMHQVRLQIERLAELSKEGRASVYCTDIVNVDFNAWQYTGSSSPKNTQLWSSLVHRVFEGIRDHMDDDAIYRTMLAEIQHQTEEVKKRQDEVVEAEKVLDQTPRPAPNRSVADVAKAEGLSQDAATLGKVLRINPKDVDVAGLVGDMRELRSTVGRLRVGWRSRPKKWKAFVGFATVLGLATLSLVVVIPAVGRAAAVLGGVLLPVLAALAAALPPALNALHAGERLLSADEKQLRAYADAKQRYDEAKDALDRLRSGASATLYDFVVDRYQTEEYRKHLGMAPLIRDDLERLAAEAKKPGNIQRVVVYIDDLDRCSTKQVVRVLEAVNLLFGFDLFVVIVAVDSRWLIKSLEEEFRAVFDTPGPSTPTSRNYLEKIIQIPFWLRPMSAAGFSQLVAALTTTPAAVVAAPRAPALPQTSTASPGIDEPEMPDIEVAPASPLTLNEDPPPPSGDDPEFVDLTPQTLTITADEIAFTQRLAPLVHTPRVAKRFVNTYQLLRLAVEDVDDFLQRRDYEPLLILLAMMTGSVDIDDGTLAAAMTSSSLDEALQYASAFADLPTDRVTPAFLNTWLPRVARFSFRGAPLPN